MTDVQFESRDFDVFRIQGLDERMAALKSTVRPKLQSLGNSIAPDLSEMTGETMHVHVAKHARRTVNPPDDTWVAWAPNKRGYKKLPHFQVGLWETHLFAWFALIYESPNKTIFADNALQELDTLREQIPQDFVWSVDHTKPDVIPQSNIYAEQLEEMLDRLQNVKKAELLCGIHIDREEPILQDGAALQKRVLDTFYTLMPLYKLAQER